jgi:hypothetical protein
MNGIGFPPELERWADTAAPAISLYRHLVEESRASSLVFTAPRTIRLLLHGAGASRTRRILSDFWGRVPPAYTGVEEAEAFLDFMSSAGLDVPGLGEAMLQDRSMLRGLEPADPVAAPQPTS